MTSRKTKSQSRSLAPAAMVLFTACAAPPEGTSELTDEQRERVEELIEETEMLTPVVEGMFGVADPLFDLEGNPTDDNAALQEGVRRVLYEVRDIWNADRIVTRPYSEFVLEAEAIAHGSLSEPEVDDYIVLGIQEDGVLRTRIGTLMHEGTHYFYGMHERGVRDIALEYSGVAEPDYAERLDRLIEMQDAPYVVGIAYEIFESLPFYLASASRRDAELMRSLVESGTYAGSSEMHQHNRDLVNEELLDLLTREGWASWVVDGDDGESGFYHSSEVREPLDLLGVTHDELLETISKQDDLYEAHRETIEGALEVWREAFPEYREEAQAERRMETRRARR